MTKSAIVPNSRIPLTEPHIIVKQIRSAVTDYIYGIAFDPAAPPGTSNTLTIILACTGETPGVLTELERYVESNHGALKKDVVEVVDEGLRKPRAEFTRLRKEKKFLEQVAQSEKDTITLE